MKMRGLQRWYKKERQRYLMYTTNVCVLNRFCLFVSDWIWAWAVVREESAVVQCRAISDAGALLSLSSNQIGAQTRPMISSGTKALKRVVLLSLSLFLWSSSTKQ